MPVLEVTVRLRPGKVYADKQGWERGIIIRRRENPMDRDFKVGDKYTWTQWSTGKKYDCIILEVDSNVLTLQFPNGGIKKV